MDNENTFGITVNLTFDYGVSAETYEEAVKYVKYMFLEQHNIELQDNDIDLTRVMIAKIDLLKDSE